MIFIVADPDQPTLQELCRCTVRRVIRTNMHKKHPELSKVRKRPRKPKKTAAKGHSNLNIVPLSMGMMILHQFDRDNSLTDSDDEERDRAIEANENSEDEDEHLMDDLEGNSGEIEAKFSSDEDDEVNDAEIMEQVMNKNENATEGKDAVNEVLKTESGVKTNGNCIVADKPIEKKSDSESDYGSDEEPESNDAIDTVADVNSTVEQVEQGARQTASRVDKIIANVMASCSPRPETDHHLESLRPPEARWSDTDDDADEDKKYNIEEFINYGTKDKNLAPPRKSRYSSNTSVDTSTTSGIGSFVEEHLDEEMGRHCDSEKISHGWNQIEPESGCSESKPQIMDIEENESNDDDKVSDEEEDVPKITLSQCMKEAIDSLPLPSSMKAYLNYYRE